MDDETKETMLHVLEQLKADSRRMRENTEKKAWKQTNLPCNLSTILTRLTKHELDLTRKYYRINGISGLKKAEMATELSLRVPDLFEQTLYKIDKEMYDIVKKIALKSGFILAPDIDFSKVKKLQEYSICFPGIHKGKKVLFMPEELIEAFKKIDAISLQKTVDRNTEWIQLTHGMLYYYGHIGTNELIKKIEHYTEKKVDAWEFLHTSTFTAEYHSQIVLTTSGYYDCRVMEKQKLVDEQRSRRDIDYYNFTKKQLLRAGVEDYMEKTPALNTFINFLQYNYDLSFAP